MRALLLQFLHSSSFACLIAKTGHSKTITTFQQHRHLKLSVLEVRSLITTPGNTLKRRVQERHMSASTGFKEFPPEKVRDVVAEVMALLKEKGESVCVAETAAGGIISASILSTPGASKMYKGGLTLYTLESRIAFAGWTQENISTYRGPTPDITASLASNVRDTLGATYCICESGTAGPTGGNTPNRTPGYVALAIATEKGVHKKDLSTGLGGDREGNMIAFAAEALSFLKDVLKGDAKL